MTKKIKKFAHGVISVIPWAFSSSAYLPIGKKKDAANGHISPFYKLNSP